MIYIGNLKNQKNPWRYWLRKTPLLALWIALPFSYNLDVYSEDFRFIPYQSVLVMMAIAAINIYTLVNQFHLKIDLNKIVDFKEWRKYKQVKKQFER